jgi:hypothetical protein
MFFVLSFFTPTRNTEVQVTHRSVAPAGNSGDDAFDRFVRSEMTRRAPTPAATQVTK